MKKLIALVVFIACVTTAIWIALTDSFFDGENTPTISFFKKKTSSKSSSVAGDTPLTLNIKKDFRYLEQNKYFGFKSEDLGDVQVLIDPQIKNQKEFQKVADLIYSQFPKSKDGKKKLEITLISGNDTNASTNQKASQKNLLVLQFSLTDRASQNKTWEMGRTYSY